jgi:hypothetical protein
MRELLAMLGVIVLLWAAGIDDGEGLLRIAGPPPVDPWWGLIAGATILICAALWRPVPSSGPDRQPRRPTLSRREAAPRREVKNVTPTSTAR